eukprot:Skav219938  [mRNA]  locus=scaffold2879:46388:47569:+ [translate_table: standard]
MNFQDALAEIQKQQAASMEKMDTLKDQHREWQKAVEDLLAHVDSIKGVQDRQVNAQPDRPMPASGDTPAVMDVALEDFQTEIPRRSQDGTPSNEVRKSRQPRKLEVSQGPLKKLVAEVLMDHDHAEHELDLTWWESQKRALFKFIKSKYFEYITGMIICLNLVMIGIEAELSIRQGDILWATWVERTFLALYTTEISLRLWAGGFALFRSPWFLLDFFLVCVGIIALVVAPVVGGDQVEAIGKVLVVRGLRLLRLARALRMVGHFKVIWRLVYGILTAGHTMLSVTALVVLWLFIFACVAVEIITMDPDLRIDPTTEYVVSSSFGSLPRSILTLLQFVTMDSNLHSELSISFFCVHHFHQFFLESEGAKMVIQNHDHNICIHITRGTFRNSFV